MRKLKILDLFSGIGGFSLGFENTGLYETVAFCEVDEYCKQLLQKHWKGVKIYNDIKNLKGKDLEEAHGRIDIVCGGFPCQPYSVAGKQKGTNDDRYLWPEMFRVITEVQPRWVVAENVRGIVNIQDGVVFERVCSDLENQGYQVQPFNIPAAGVGAPHQRERIWIVGHSKHYGPLASEIERRYPQDDARSTEGENSTIESERTSRPRDNEIMENTNNNGHERGLIETRNQVSPREKSQINGSENTDISSGRSNGRRDNEQSRVDGEVQRLRDDDKKESTRATGIRGLHERTDISQGIAREDRNQEDDSRALVQEGQSRIQSSIDRRLEQDQTASEDNQIRRRNDNTSLNRMETRDKTVENTRRTLRQGASIGGTNENEIREEDANKFERSSETPASIMANSESIRSRESREFNQTQGSAESNATQSNSSSADGAHSNIEGSQGQWPEHELCEGEGETQISWPRRWEFEPDVGRVANGVQGRVHRLKALGNSIVPQIAEEIARAIGKAEYEKN